MLRFVNGRVHDQRDAVSRSFSYRVTAGDDRSMPWIPVDVVDPPEGSGKRDVALDGLAR